MRLPERLARNVRGSVAMEHWAAALPATVRELVDRWNLEVGEPFEPGGECSWVAPVTNVSGDAFVLKIGRRHAEAENEADALRVWDGAGAVRLVDAATTETALVLLLERCRPGTSLKKWPEPEQDEVIAALLRRLWRPAGSGWPFRPLVEMCDQWADEALQSSATELVAEGAELFRRLPRERDDAILLVTDLHAGNVLAAEREPWLVIDPKPYVGDPAYDVVQHLLNCEVRLATDPVALAYRMAELTGVDPYRVVKWLFARCAMAAAGDPECEAVAQRLAATGLGRR